MRALRSHRLLVLVITLLALAAAVGWLAHRSPQYEAKAEILVSPLPQDDQTFTGMPDILRDSPSDPTRTIQTAATFVDSPLAAALAAKKVDHGYTLDSVQSAITVEPQGESNILAVTAKVANDKHLTAQLANQFAAAALQVRGQALNREIQAQLNQLQQRLRTVPRGDAVTRGSIASQVNQLEAANNGKDPTLSLLENARVPSSPVGAPAWLVIALSLVAGFMVAMGTALLIELLDRHVRDTDEMLALYPLPVLARIPKLPRRLAKGADGASPLSMPPAVREGFRTLLVQLQQRPNAKTIMVTSATSRDGKTTSAINLAYALVGAGHKVILVDFDLRKPDVGKKLGAKAERGLVSLLAEDSKLSDLLVPAAQLPALKVVPAGTEGDVVLLEALTRRLPELLKEAEELADYVILDTAPLGEVSDALRIADQVDGIIVVARPGHTARANFQLMRDLLEQTGQTPLGFLVIGATPGATSAYYAYGLPQRRDAGRPRFARSSLR